jgi:hypothetical protein
MLFCQEDNSEAASYKKMAGRVIGISNNLKCSILSELLSYGRLLMQEV